MATKAARKSAPSTGVVKMQARYSRPQGDQKVPEVQRAPLPVSDQGDRPGCQDQSRFQSADIGALQVETL